MSPQKYTPLPQKELDGSSEEDVVDGDRLRSRRRPVRCIHVLLVLSVIINVGQSLVLYLRSPRDESEEPSPYVGLRRDETKPFAHVPHENSQDPALSDDFWSLPDFNPNLLTVAVDVGWAAEKGLPTTQLWPWDKNKGIYSVQAMHLLHCTKTLHIALNEFRDNKTQTWHWSHVMHCVGLLREDAMCNADDHLLYTGKVHGQEDIAIPVPGAGQMRKCKNWSHLYEWIRERSACYWPIPLTEPNSRETDRYKFCPDSRTYW